MSWHTVEWDIVGKRPDGEPVTAIFTAPLDADATEVAAQWAHTHDHLSGSDGHIGLSASLRSTNANESDDPGHSKKKRVPKRGSLNA